MENPKFLGMPKYLYMMKMNIILKVVGHYLSPSIWNLETGGNNMIIGIENLKEKMKNDKDESD